MLDGLDCTGSSGVTENNSRGRADDSTSRAENRVSSLSLTHRFNYGSKKISSRSIEHNRTWFLDYCFVRLCWFRSTDKLFSFYIYIYVYSRSCIDGKCSLAGSIRRRRKFVACSIVVTRSIKLIFKCNCIREIYCIRKSIRFS